MMKNNMCPKILLSATIDDERSRGRQCRAVRDSMVEEIDPIMPNVGKYGLIDRWMMCSNEAANWEHMVKNMLFRDRPNASSNNEENEDDDD